MGFDPFDSDIHPVLYLVLIGRKIKGLQPVHRYIGQLFFKILIHEFLVLIFRIICIAGPATKKDFCSGAFDI